MGAQGTTAEQRPRITALPGPSRLVRISEGAWAGWRETVLGQEPAAEITEEQILELERVGLLVAAPGGGDGLTHAPQWEQVLRAGLRSPVAIELVCVDGAEGWTTQMRIAGRFVVVIDQPREVTADARTVRLGRRGSGVILGVTTIEHLSATFEQLVPQRPAFTDAEPTPAPQEWADAPAVAEVQMLVVSSPSREQTVVSGGSWYACGRSGEQLAVLVPGADGVQARQLEPGSLTSAMRAKVIAAIDHAAALGGAA